MIRLSAQETKRCYFIFLLLFSIVFLLAIEDHRGIQEPLKLLIEGARKSLSTILVLFSCFTCVQLFVHYPETRSRLSSVLLFMVILAMVFEDAGRNIERLRFFLIIALVFLNPWRLRTGLAKVS